MTAPARQDDRPGSPGRQPFAPQRSSIVGGGLMDQETLAAILGVTPRHVRRMVAERRIPFVKVGRWVRFHPKDVAAWVERNRVPEGGTGVATYR
jgi:excisionase family DNA binding protein